LIVADISIHIEPAKGALERIDQSVMVLVEFLKVIVQDLVSLGIWRPTGSALPARVIPLPLLEYSMVREVRLRFDDGKGIIVNVAAANTLLVGLGIEPVKDV